MSYHPPHKRNQARNSAGSSRHQRPPSSESWQPQADPGRGGVKDAGTGLLDCSPRLTDQDQAPLVCVVKLVSTSEELKRVEALAGYDQERLAFLVSKEGRKQSKQPQAEALQLFQDVSKREGHEVVVSTPVQPHQLPLLYYAVAGGNKELVQHFLDAGAAFDMKATTFSSKQPPSYRDVPVIAVAAALGDHEMLQLLLSRGADPLGIPHDMWLPEMEQMEYHGLPQVVQDQAAAASSWCWHPDDHQLLSRRLVGHVVMPYWLTRAQKIRGQMTARNLQVLREAGLLRAQSLRLAVPGQEVACSLLYNTLRIHYGPNLNHRSNKPAVVVMAGPSGHGKSMLSSFMQPIMAAGGDSDYLFLDCAGINSPDMLLGMPGWYRGAGKRPKLAELLWNRRGKRCVVVLDEFEKMAGGAQEDLLRVFDEGTFVDRLEQQPVCCRNAIFLITTNVADDVIQQHWELHQADVLQACGLAPSAMQRHLTNLLENIGRACESRLGAPFSSRVTATIPFLPFTKLEQAIVAATHLYALQRRLAGSAPKEKEGTYPSNIKLRFDRMVKLSSTLGPRYYHPTTGARKLFSQLGRHVADDLSGAYLDGEIDDGSTVVMKPDDNNQQPFLLRFPA